VVICLERAADCLHMFQLMLLHLLPLLIPNGFSLPIPAYQVVVGKEAVRRV